MMPRRADYQLGMHPCDDFRPGAKISLYATDRHRGKVLQVNALDNIMVIQVEAVEIEGWAPLPPEIRVLQLLEPNKLGDGIRLEGMTWGVAELIRWEIATEDATSKQT